MWIFLPLPDLVSVISNIPFTYPALSWVITHESVSSVLSCPWEVTNDILGIAS